MRFPETRSRAEAAHADAISKRDDARERGLGGRHRAQVLTTGPG
jgi:hypothetical protein